MIGRKADFEWQVLEDGASRRDSGAVDRHEQTRVDRQGRWRRVAKVAAALLLALIIGDLPIAFQRAEQGLLHVEEDIGRTAAAELWAVRNGDESALEGLLDSEAPAVWLQVALREASAGSGQHITESAVSVRLLELRDEYALVGVSLDGEAESEARFYRESGGSWLRTSPKDVFWGEEQRYESRHFVFHHRERDAAAVEEAAAKLDVSYDEIQRILGTEPGPNDQKLRVEVRPALFLNDAPYGGSFAGDTLEIASPPLPAANNRADGSAVIYAQVAGPLAAYAVDRALVQRRIVCMWQPVADGVGLWLRGRYASPAGERGSAAEPALQERIAHGSLRLMQLNAAAAKCAWYAHADEADDAEAHLQTLASRTMVEYAVDTYGESTIAELLDAFRRHYTWGSLVPAVFGVPATAFEEGWQEFLDTQTAGERSARLVQPSDQGTGTGRAAHP